MDLLLMSVSVLTTTPPLQVGVKGVKSCVKTLTIEQATGGHWIKTNPFIYGDCKQVKECDSTF